MRKKLNKLIFFYALFIHQPRVIYIVRTLGKERTVRKKKKKNSSKGVSPLSHQQLFFNIKKKNSLLFFLRFKNGTLQLLYKQLHLEIIIKEMYYSIGYLKSSSLFRTNL